MAGAIKKFSGFCTLQQHVTLNCIIPHNTSLQHTDGPVSDINKGHISA
jgi:hypothetical protein